MHIKTIDYFGDTYKLYKSEHITEVRDNSKIQRDFNITTEHYIDIFKSAMYNGLTQL
jgi:hypothetical protein